MSAFVDGRCTRCSRRLGAAVGDQPVIVTCTCGHQQTFEPMRMIERLTADEPPWRRKRMAAEMTLRDAARALDMSCAALSSIEQGTVIPNEEIRAALERLYAG